tara:strand:- start:9728 stop:10738 length:1011 start_codon:yes stop_codon:yes gene_type:complete
MINFKKVYIIAEAGVNHNGSFNLAKKLIFEAKKTGADAIKFQSFNADKLAIKKTPLAKYQKKKISQISTHYQMLKKLELSELEIRGLNKFAKKLKIDFISTPFDVNSAKLLNSLNVKYFKTASPDLSDYYLHKYLSSTNKKVIISTGMSNVSEIKKCIKFYRKKNIILMHCVSSYPAPDESLNLKCLSILKEYSSQVGYSDHSLNNTAAIIAVSLGAKVVEKHFTLNNKMRGPDHFFSLNPNKFKEFVDQIRTAEKMLGEKKKECQKIETEIKKISIKSVVAYKNLKKGEKITLNNICLKRPNSGISGFDVKKIVGKKLNKNIKKDQSVKLSDFVN